MLERTNCSCPGRRPAIFPITPYRSLLMLLFISTIQMMPTHAANAIATTSATASKMGEVPMTKINREITTAQAITTRKGGRVTQVMTHDTIITITGRQMTKHKPPKILPITMPAIWPAVSPCESSQLRTAQPNGSFRRLPAGTLKRIEYTRPRPPSLSVQPIT